METDSPFKHLRSVSEHVVEFIDVGKTSVPHHDLNFNRRFYTGSVRIFLEFFHLVKDGVFL